MDPVRREYILVTIAGTVTMLSGGMSFPIFAKYVEIEFTAPILLIGVAVSGYFIIRMFAELPFGAISDRLGPRKPLLIGRILAIVGAFITWSATDVYQLVIARALWGVGDASFFCISTAYVAKLFSVRGRGRALGAFQSVEMIGSFLGQSIGGLIATPLGIRNIFLVNACMGFITLTLTGMLGSQEDSPTHAQSTGGILPSRKMLGSAINVTVAIACAMNFLLFFRNMGIMSTIAPIYLTGELGISLAEYGFLMAISTAGGAFGTVSGGWLSDKFERWKILTFGFILGAAATYMFSVADTFTSLLTLMVLNGYSWGAIYSVTPALVADSVPESLRGMAIGAYRSFLDLGGLVGPVVMGFIVELAGKPQGFVMAFYVGAAIMLLNLPLTALLTRRSAADEKSSP
ncbi:MAG: MFS transporter [Candidatus Bathyarchaeia archaeon]